MSADNKHQQEAQPVTDPATAAPAAEPSVAPLPEASPEASPEAERVTGERPAAPAEAAATEPPPLTAPAKRAWSRSFLVAYIAAVPLLVVLGAAAAWYYLDDQFNRRLEAVHAAHAQLRDSVEAAVQRVQAIEARVQPLAGRVEQMGGDIGELKTLTMPTAQLAAKAADIEQRLQRLDEQLQLMAATHLQASDLLDRMARLETNAVRSATLDQRVQSLEASGAAAREALMRGSSIVLAAGQLLRTVEDGEPFAAQLTTLRVVAAGDEQLSTAIRSLEPFAATGVPTMARLRAEFPATALAVSRAEGAARGEEWYDRIVNRISTLVMVRRTGPEAVAAGGTSGRLAAAEQALAAGALSAAVDAVAGIEGPGAAAAAPWLSEARARLTAAKALASLEDRAIAYLSQVKG